MDVLNTLFIIIVILSFVIYHLYFTRSALVTNKLHNTKRQKISLIKEGEIVNVVGKIKYFDKPLIAPLSGRKCAYYHVIVEQKDRSGNSLTGYYNIIEEEVSGNVVICNGNDCAIIDTNLVKSYIIKDKEYYSDIFKDPNVRLQNYLEKHSYKSVDFLGFNENLRYKEGILEEGETVAVAGKAVWKSKSEIDFKIPFEKILVISPDNRKPVFFSDEPFAVGLEK